MLYRRIVAKFGTNLLTGGSDQLDLSVMADLVGQVARLHKEGAEMLVVTSGAMAAGRHKLGLKKGRRDVPFRQVLAAVGQGRLLHIYEELFAEHGITIAQTLLTRADLADRLGYLNARNTLLALLELKVVSIINENDVVAVEEIEGSTFGDNDNLSAMVANLVDADLLALLGDVGGLYTADPNLDATARLIPRVERIDAAIEGLAGGSTRGIGGMVTKVQAARLATASGVAMVIADGRQPQALLRLAHGEALGTFFSPTASKLESRKRWMLSQPARGRLVVDDGAVFALREQNKSLLPAGISEVSGPFQRGEMVAICDPLGQTVACGLANYSSEDIAQIKGQRSQRIAALLGYQYGAEVVHRDNLVVL